MCYYIMSLETGDNLTQKEIDEFKNYILMNWIFMFWESNQEVIKKNLELVISLKDEFNDFTVNQAEKILADWDNRKVWIQKIKDDVNTALNKDQ